MKKFLYVMASLALLFSGCTRELETRLSDVETRLAKVEDQVKELNSQVSLIQNLIKNTSSKVLLSSRTAPAISWSWWTRTETRWRKPY